MFPIAPPLGDGILWAYAESEGPDQTARPRSLIWAFAVLLQIRWVSQNVPTAEQNRQMRR